MEKLLAQGQERQRLADYVGRVLGLSGGQITTLSPLSGGAIQENWLLGYRTSDGRLRELVLRSDGATLVPGSRPKEQEFSILRLAHEGGVTAPRPLALYHDRDLLGRPFILMEKLPGTTDQQTVLAFGDGEKLAEQLGRELAKIHALDPAPLDFLEQPEPSHARKNIADCRAFFDARGEARPIAEWALRWCEVHEPEIPAGGRGLVHGDFRTANYLVGEGGLCGILDWEFAGLGDPYSDLGWFCARCWRYGREDKPAGGIASRAAFYRGYAEQSGSPVDHERVLYWEVLSLLRWLVIAIQQGDRNFIAGERDLELGLTGLVRPLEIEQMLLEMTPPELWRKGRGEGPA